MCIESFIGLQSFLKIILLTLKVQFILIKKNTEYQDFMKVP